MRHMRAVIIRAAIVRVHRQSEVQRVGSVSKNKRVALVSWVDSSTINKGAWTYPEQIHPQPLCECVSVGWIIKQDKK